MTRSFDASRLDPSWALRRAGEQHEGSASTLTVSEAGSQRRTGSGIGIPHRSYDFQAERDYMINVSPTQNLSQFIGCLDHYLNI